MSDNNLLESKVNDVIKVVEELKNTPNQAVVDKTMSLLVAKLNDRDRIIDLELKNLSKSIKLDIQQTLDNAHKSLEERIDSKIRETISAQRDRVSWGMEIIRFAVVVVMFILSIKLVS